MSKVKYRQCSLQRDNKDGGHSKTVSYLPEKFAVVGRVLKLKDDDDTWTDGWVVLSASTELTDEPPDWRKSIRGHRSNTGDSLPKQERVPGA